MRRAFVIKARPAADLNRRPNAMIPEAKCGPAKELRNAVHLIVVLAVRKGEKLARTHCAPARQEAKRAHHRSGQTGRSCARLSSPPAPSRSRGSCRLGRLAEAPGRGDLPGP